MDITMTGFLDLLNFITEWIYCGVFFIFITAFLPLRGKSRLLHVLAFFASSFVSETIIYPEDPWNLFGALFGLCAYIMVFHRGRWTEKLTTLLVFYPAFTAINYMMIDLGASIFFSLPNAPVDGTGSEWSGEQRLMNNVVLFVSEICRLSFWTAAWRIFRKPLRQIISNLTTKMWLVVDVIMLAPFVSVLMTMLFIPRHNPLFVYPICIASVLTSFGCIYLTIYLCGSMQTAYRAQELEMRQAYYRDRVSEEERVRSIYHDLKNHLLVLQAQADQGHALQLSVRELENRIRDYENYYHTGNEYLDIIIRDKARAAREKGIDFSAEISLEHMEHMLQPLDISTIFGNALDNAIEASVKLPEEQRLITIKGSRIHDLQMIVVENNVLPGGEVPAGTSKEDTFLHGFGLTNINAAVEKYGGSCSTKVENGMFRLKIVIPVESAS